MQLTGERRAAPQLVPERLTPSVYTVKKRARRKVADPLFSVGCSGRGSECRRVVLIIGRQRLQLVA